MHELVHERFVGLGHLSRRPLGHDMATGQEVHVIHDLQGFLNVVGNDNGRRAKCIIQPADQVADNANRNRVKTGKRFVVHDEHGIERNCACKRYTPRHSSG